jgi:hypothetical protein
MDVPPLRVVKVCESNGQHLGNQAEIEKCSYVRKPELTPVCRCLHVVRVRSYGHGIVLQGESVKGWRSQSPSAMREKAELKPR